MPNRLDPTFVRAQIENLRHTHPGIWDDDDPQLLMDSLEGETDLVEFLSHVVFRMQEDAAFGEGIGALITKLKTRQGRYEQRSDAMRALAQKVMDWAKVRKVELAAATLSIHAGSQKVIITDEAALPPDCIRVRTEPNKTVIKEHLARGEHVAGAEMSNAEPYLAVRVK